MINMLLKSVHTSHEAAERAATTVIPIKSGWLCPSCDIIFSRIKAECPLCTSENIIRTAAILDRKANNENHS